MPFSRARSITFLPLLLLTVSTHALAQSDISPTNKFCFTENTGWLNWRDAGDPPAAEGVRFHNTFLSGYIWAENIGYINVGDGTPQNAATYANLNADDFGVNIGPDGNLSGYAWSENTGWITFSTGALGGNRARFDHAAQRFRGYAWGENIGWVNLDDPNHYVSLGAECSADCDANGFVNSADAGCFLTLYFQDLTNGTLNADFDNNAITNSADVGAYLTAYFSQLGPCN